jgi:hypothetical protein
MRKPPVSLPLPRPRIHTPRLVKLLQDLFEFIAINPEYWDKKPAYVLAQWQKQRLPDTTGIIIRDE